MAISRKVREQMNNSSWIRRMFEQGIELRNIHGNQNVFDLSLGNPLLEPPTAFKVEHVSHTHLRAHENVLDLA